MMQSEFRLVSVVSLAIIAALVLAGCGPSETHPQTVSSSEDIAGIWESSVGLHRFGEDGTHQWGHSVEALRTLSELRGGEYWFEDGRHYHTATVCPSEEPGIYEIRFIEEGKVAFAVVEDDRSRRAWWLVGYGAEPRVWTKVE
jgi:hypothetical protein